LAIFQQLGYFCRIIGRIAQERQYLGIQVYNIFAYIICLKTWLVFWHHLAWQPFWLLSKNWEIFVPYHLVTLILLADSTKKGSTAKANLTKNLDMLRQVAERYFK
jgi:hypothetical protein